MYCLGKACLSSRLCPCHSNPAFPSGEGISLPWWWLWPLSRKKKKKPGSLWSLLQLVRGWESLCTPRLINQFHPDFHCVRPSNSPRSSHEQDPMGSYGSVTFLMTWCLKKGFLNSSLLVSFLPYLPLSSSLHFILFVTETQLLIRLYNHFPPSSRVLSSREPTGPLSPPRAGLPLSPHPPVPHSPMASAAPHPDNLF